MRGKTLLVLAGLLGAGLLGYRNLPPHLNPLAPLALDDPPGWLTSFKLRRLTADQCASLLAEANRRRLIASRPVADSEGSCPLRNVVRVANFGSVQLSSSFLASCPLALSSALYIEQQAKPLTRQLMASDLRQIDHLGSFACRNIYHRQQARRSEHATADALDVSGFRLADGRRVSVLQGWRSETSRPWLAVLLSSSCHYFGNALGPDNAAHANHFHFGMRGQGFCF
ncbi:extensin family protein [Klebsiella pneumoniae]